MRRVVAALLAIGLAGTGRLEGRDEQLPGWFDLPVRGGVETLAALGIPLEDRAVTLPILARALHDRESRVGLTSAKLLSILAAMTATTGLGGAGDVITIAAPLDAKTWRDLLTPAKTDDIFARLLTDRNALFVAVGLMSGDDTLRALAQRDRDLLRFLYRDVPGAFVLAARRLHVADGKVVVPGGVDAEPIWQALVGESPARPVEFIRLLLLKDQGRLAWYFDTIGSLDAQRLAVAWPDGATRLEAATALYESFRTSDPQWRIPEQPFRRGVIDAWTVVTQNAIADRQLAGPGNRAFWETVFTNDRVDGERIARALREPSAPVTLQFLTQATLTGLTLERRQRFEMFRLAQRMFSSAPPSALPDVAVALSGLRPHRALLFALERMQVTDPHTWAVVVDAARHVSREADNRRESVVAFQGVIALIERIRHARTLDVPATDRLLRSLSEAVTRDDRVIQSLTQWMPDIFVPALPPLIRPDAWTTRTAYESRVMQAMAGPIERPTRVLDWEGLSYSVDVVAAEHDRIRAMRTLLPSPGLDNAIQSAKPRDLAAALTTLVYVTALGDPEGPASLSPDVVTRHDLGMDGTSVIRDIAPWAPPEERQGLGAWHMHGSLIGLDLGLARLALRRVADQQMPSAPTLTLNDLGTLTRTAVVMSSADLTDEHRDELAAAIARGRQRVASAHTAMALATLGREVGISDTTRQLLPWIVSRQRDVAAGVFSLRDLMWLGKPQLSRAEIDRWGVAADGIDSRRVAAMPDPAPWEDYAGRSEAGQITTQVPDLTLRLVEETSRRKLPAVLIPSLLAFALEDYWHEVRARFSDDWFQLTRQAAALSSARVEDYIAALTGNGPLRTQ